MLTSGLELGKVASDAIGTKPPTSSTKVIILASTSASVWNSSSERLAEYTLLSLVEVPEVTTASPSIPSTYISLQRWPLVPKSKELLLVGDKCVALRFPTVSWRDVANFKLPSVYKATTPSSKTTIPSSPAFAWICISPLWSIPEPTLFLIYKLLCGLLASCALSI